MDGRLSICVEASSILVQGAKVSQIDSIIPVQGAYASSNLVLGANVKKEKKQV